MSLHSDVEALARALGVWLELRDDGSVASLPDYGIDWALCRPRRDGDAWAGALPVPPHGSFALARTSDPHVVVDAPTAAIILLGHARGLRVDIGECLACRERGGKRGLALWEWMHATCPAQVGDAETAGWGGGAHRICDERERLSEARNGVLGPREKWVMGRPCPACAVDGEPTGRHMLAWERAILEATKPCPVRRCESGRAPHPHGFLEGSACRRCRGSGRVDGDPATRTALTVLAHRLAEPEHVAVFGDWCESGHEPAAFPGVPRSGFAALLAWWLAGPDVLAQHDVELSRLVLLAAVDLHLAAV